MVDINAHCCWSPTFVREQEMVKHPSSGRAKGRTERSWCYSALFFQPVLPFDLSWSVLAIICSAHARNGRGCTEVKVVNWFNNSNSTTKRCTLVAGPPPWLKKIPCGDIERCRTPHGHPTRCPQPLKFVTPNWVLHCSMSRQWFFKAHIVQGGRPGHLCNQLRLCLVKRNIWAPPLYGQEFDACGGLIDFFF